MFELAVTLESSEWPSFLDLQCGTDEELRREVESLLLAHEHSSNFLEEPVMSAGALADFTEAPPKPSDSIGVGSRIGAYQLEREVGHGGMGTVYLANRADEEFRKRVAIKVIRVEKLSEFAIRRFRQERQILARLEHSNVARLIDGGTTESGMPYLVMEFVEGEILTRYCDLHGLAVTERCELFLKICSAVQYAHERSIIHRDLKPANILVGRTGNPKLLDFGVAKMLEPENPAFNKEATQAGIRMLTPAYASPEQLRGEPVTAQSDIYSLGVILYELVCGERPSLKTVQQSSSQPDGKDEHISPGLRAIIFNAIRLDPTERYESVAAMAEDIQKHLKGFPTSAGLPPSGDEDVERISIGVLPFRELGQDKKADPFLRSAITDALITRLSKVERLSVRPTSAVLRYAESSDPVQAARELRVRFLLEGTFHTVGDHVRLNVQLVSSDTGRSVWAAHFDEESTDLLRLEDSISEQIAFALIPHLTGEERQKLSRAGTANSKAHESYLRGRYHWSRSAGEPEQLAKALTFFMEAIALDASYARAHSGVADYYVRLGLWGGVPPAESFAAALVSARRALALDPALGDAHASLGFCLWTNNRDYDGAEREFNIAIAQSPDSANAHHWFGLLNSARGRPELALANLDRAHKIDPNSPVITASHGFVYFNSREYQQAIDLLQGAARERRDSGVLQELQAWCYLQMGDAAHARECASKAANLSARGPSSLAVLSRTEAALGNRAVCQEILAEMKQLETTRFVSGYDFASVYLALGDKAAALTSLEQAFEARDWWVNWIGVHPAWDGLRGEPRFAALVSHIQPEPADKTETGPRVSAKPDPKAASMLVLAVVAVLVLGALALTYFQSRKTGEPFADPQFSRITGDGTTGLATVSPNGEYIVYTTRKKGWTQVWKRKVGTSASTPVTGPIQGDAVSLEFTDNGNRVAFALHPALQLFHRNLFTVPLQGGVPVQILGEVPGPVGISRDGTKAAIVRANRALNRDEIWIEDLKNGGERLITSRQYPTHLLSQASPAFSRNGKRLAFSVETKDSVGFYIYLQTIDLETGKEQRLQSPRWQWVEDIEWFSGQSALAIVARPQGSSFKQIWYIGYPDGRSRRLGSDIDSYNTVSISDDGETLASIQLQTLTNIYVAPPNDVDHSVQVTPGTGRYFDLSWTSDGRILYASDCTGEADLWTIKADGSDQQQITSGGGLKWAPVSSPDGKYIAYHSNKSGSWNIWRTDADGSNPVQITQGPRDSNWPHFTPDSKFIVFHQTDPGGQLNLWKVPVEGGTPVKLTTSLTTHPAVSRKDGKIVAWYSETLDHPQWKLAVFAPTGGAPLQVFTPSVAISADSQLGWSPAGDAITCLGQQNGAWNVWNQPIDGRPAKRLTSFVSGQVYSFDWSKDGRLALSQGVSTTDVVIVRDKRRK